MKSKKTKLVTSTLLLMSVGSLLAACGTPSASTTPNAGATAGNSYPLQTDANTKLGFWEIGSNNLTSFSSYDQVPFYQKWQTNTGVKMSYTIPAAGSNGPQSLSIMLASGNLPDMMSYTWLTYPGGPAKAIKDGYIARLNDLIDKDAPNLKTYLKAHPDVDKMLKTDNGDYYVFPFIRGDAKLQSYWGPVIRKDWLDQLNLQVPVTIDDWHTVLTAFKNQKGAAAPITFKLDGTGKPGFDTYNAAVFVSAFGTAYGMFVDNNGKVQFGPEQPQFKQFLTTFHQWFTEGLIDKDFATVDQKTQDADMTNGKSGATLGTAGGNMGSWTPAGKKSDPKYDLVPAPYPVLKKGDKPMLGQLDPIYSASNAVAIAGTSNNKDLAAKVLDYGYSDAGRMFFNFGTEGVSYNMVNGYPTYSDLIMKNPQNLSPAQAMS
ncbi:MAG: transporter substrate-binding protein, partial [Bacilli bacterium]|nr:transporter substrate-binding protein [Bacilli bacterium]